MANAAPGGGPSFPADFRPTRSHAAHGLDVPISVPGRDADILVGEFLQCLGAQLVLTPVDAAVGAVVEHVFREGVAGLLEHRDDFRFDDVLGGLPRCTRPHRRREQSMSWPVSSKIVLWGAGGMRLIHGHPQARLD